MVREQLSLRLLLCLFQKGVSGGNFVLGNGCDRGYLHQNAIDGLDPHPYARRRSLQFLV